MEGDNPEVHNAEIAALLRDIAERLGRGYVPNDPEQASRSDRPLNWHVVHLGESLHVLRNAVQVLIGIIEQLGDKLDHNASISQENAEAIAQLTAISRTIEISAGRIEETVGVAIPDRPLLMRDLVWLDTNPTEIWLIFYTAGEAMVFLIGSDALIRSAMFNALASLLSSNYAWGIGAGLLSLCSLIAFTARGKMARRVAAFVNAVYFLTSGLLTLLLAGGVLGWLPHLLAGAFALWVLGRGPSRAT